MLRSRLAPLSLLSLLGLAVWLALPLRRSQAQQAAPIATLDLFKEADRAVVQTQWRYQDVKVVGNDIDVKAHAPNFDDSQWEVITDPQRARGPGRVCFNWYRLAVTLPQKVGDVDVTGSTVMFTTTVDDYGEVYVDGNIDLAFGRSGAGAVSGFNTPNRVTVARDIKAGDKHVIAIFGMNGPIGRPPGNMIFLRNALLTFHK